MLHKCAINITWKNCIYEFKLIKIDRYSYKLAVPKTKIYGEYIYIYNVFNLKYILLTLLLFDTLYIYFVSKQFNSIGFYLTIN